jgi:hypothetical protein
MLSDYQSVILQSLVCGYMIRTIQMCQNTVAFVNKLSMAQIATSSTSKLDTEYSTLLGDSTTVGTIIEKQVQILSIKNWQFEAKQSSRPKALAGQHRKRHDMPSESNEYSPLRVSFSEEICI